MVGQVLDGYFLVLYICRDGRYLEIECVILSQIFHFYYFHDGLAPIFRSTTFANLMIKLCILD